MHKIINFSHILPDNKKTNTVTPQIYLSLTKDMSNTAKYSKSRKMVIFLHKKCQVFSLKFHDFPFKSIHFDEMTCSYKIVFFIMHGKVYIFGIKVISRLIGLI